MVVRDGRPSYYNALAPHDLRDYGRVLAWIKSVWLPIVPELTAANSHEIMNRKIIVLGILSRDRTEEFTLARKELKEAAVEFMQQRQGEEQAERKRLRDQKQLRLDEAEDRSDDRGIRAAKDAHQHDRAPGGRLRLGRRHVLGAQGAQHVRRRQRGRRAHHHQRRRRGLALSPHSPRSPYSPSCCSSADAGRQRKQYWDLTVNGEYINTSRSRILDPLRDVLSKAPSICSMSTTTRLNRVYFLAKAGAHGHPWLSVALLVAALLVLVGRGRMKRKAGGFFRLDGKEGFLGGQTQGKVD
jgi:protein disulfide-isomerase